MSDEQNSKTTGKQTRTPKNIDDEIEKAAQRLKNLENKKKKLDQKKREENRKGIDTLLQSRKLDQVDVEVWRQKIDDIENMLLEKPGQVGEPANNGSSRTMSVMNPQS